MKTLFIILLLAYSSSTIACQCLGACLDQTYNLVAQIEVVEKSPKYEEAYKAKILRIKHFKPVIQLNDKFEVINPGYSTRPEYITIADYGVRPKTTTEKQVESITVGCAGVGGYEIGKKYYFFGQWVQDNIYRSPPCSCSIRLE